MVAKMDCKSSEKPKQKPKQKPKYRKGLWSPEEDQRLRNYILKHGLGCWSSVPINAGLQRNGKSCRLRWINYLRPGLKRGMFSVHEEEIIMTIHRLLGNKWSQIAQHLPGRTDNEIKNYWHSYLKKRMIKTKECETQTRTDQSVSSNSDNNTELPCYESSENMGKSSADNNTDQSVPHISIDSLKEVNKPSSSSLPKLMFAEWLSLDSFANVRDDPSVACRSNNVSDDNSTYHENNLIHEYLLNGTTFGDMFGPFKFEEHSTGSDDQFVNFSCGEDLCIDFEINNDIMYL